MELSGPLPKPRLRGRIHLYSSFVAVGAGGYLLSHAHAGRAAAVASVYSASLVFLLAVSALYHVPTWPPRKRLWFRRLDHSAIFVLIAGTATPLFALALPGEARFRALALIWGAASLGVAQSIFWARAPKGLVAALCVGMGWLALPYVRALSPRLGASGLLLLLLGGIAYSLGAVVYALRRPDPAPGTFGYHEVFHALVVLAAICHYVVVFRVVTSG